MSIKFPYSRQQVTEADAELVTRALLGPMLTQGAEVPAFESELASTLGAAHVIACNSGTAALHLAYMGVGLGPERGLITSPVTFLATANAARMCGAPVTFADVDPVTGNIDPESVRKILRDLNGTIAAITPVHLGGRPADIIALRSIADEFNCSLIEDACHAPGATYRDNTGERFVVGACAHSDMACFSFHAIKHIAMGEGGAVTTGSAVFAADLAMLRSHGITRDQSAYESLPEPDAPWYYEMHSLGWNYRITDFQCALGRAQLQRLDASLADRQRIADRYRQHLSDIPHVKLPPMPNDATGHAWHLYALAIDFAELGTTRSAVMRELAARGVGTQVHYIPLYHQPYYKREGHQPLAGAEAYYQGTLSIPMYPQLTDDDIAEISGIIRKVLTA